MADSSEGTLKRLAEGVFGISLSPVEWRIGYEHVYVALGVEIEQQHEPVLELYCFRGGAATIRKATWDSQKRCWVDDPAYHDVPLPRWVVEATERKRMLAEASGRFEDRGD